ncbi:Putative NADPH-quinone reductase (modulator of drug activity B) [Pseudovibrio denitrificans]|uniref:Putative NADPH-quinone reductase (Modulator of drug activity B) n=1 Tax=Pseudovibrio denitrificans TaxID=258256 RepID=A0A1I7DDY5_9HYPH|nr:MULTISPECIES: NAD(P)H-dependent oxidoreductase [Pseudovibrio]EEA94543.1 putative NADPH-quinone reductase [Pseudovibrio sp. JE062]SFU09899.1 Putative NADPH-quinone reductase (modulator of drug activity B) [Pseudovibrio denitrificans]
MRVLIVFNHPYEGSYCNAVLGSVMKGLLSNDHEVDLIHLDKDEFDPVMRSKDLKAFVSARTQPQQSAELLDPQVQNYKERLQRAEHIIFIFPIWWELMPALTKGFIDKVIFPGIAYDYNEHGTRMLCKLSGLRGVTMITTMNTPSIAYRLIFGNAIKKALLTGTFWKMGVKNRNWINLTYVKFCKESKRKKWLSEIQRSMAKLA